MGGASPGKQTNDLFIYPKENALGLVVVNGGCAFADVSALDSRGAP
jgi:hypothetical protein